ncbi:MAG: hypothetical protein ACLFM4_10285 [Phormidium sp.]
MYIDESNMRFGPFLESDCFPIEKSQTYQEIRQGVKIAEFALIRHSESDSNPVSLWIVEAKSSSPRPNTQPNFRDFIEEIQVKLTNTLSLTLAIALKRHKTWQELPKSFQNLDWQNIRFVLILVIQGHDAAWLPDLDDALKYALQSTRQIWGGSVKSEVLVLNDQFAQKHGLITPP